MQQEKRQKSYTGVQVEPDCICSNTRQHKHWMIPLWRLHQETHSAGIENQHEMNSELHLLNIL